MFKMVRNDYHFNLLHRFIYHPDDTLSTDERTMLITQALWRQRSVNWWNCIPHWLRVEQNLRQFRKFLHHWLLENIAMFAGDEDGDGNDDI